MASNRPVQVLLVEDDPGDVRLTEEALKKSKLLVMITVVEDGEKALQYLRQEGPYKNVVRPDLVLLDLNLPRVDGRQVLEQAKGDPKLRAIPIVVLTTSSADADILKAYGLGGNCYITKPVGFEEFRRIVRSIEEFWFEIVKLPPR
ncbi:MAG: response regulator [Elusimicrobia bacterium]|nr:response regulator [Elusimicrobiota bacterium]